MTIAGYVITYTSFRQLSLQDLIFLKIQQHCCDIKNSSTLNRPNPPASTGTVILDAAMFSLPFAKVSRVFWKLFSIVFDGIKNDPKWERGEISRLLITHILPGTVRLNLFQNSIFFLMLERMVSKLEFHLAGSAEIVIPKIFVSPQSEKPRSRTCSGTGIMLPICKMEIFSMLHLNPEKSAKFCRMVFSAFRLSKLKIVATLMSSANPSALSVSHFDSVAMAWVGGPSAFLVWISYAVVIQVSAQLITNSLRSLVNQAIYRINNKVSSRYFTNCG